MGCSALGNLYHAVSDSAAVDAVHRAVHLGIRYFDTAPHYGFGLSEQRLGAALASIDATKVLISTKVGRLLRPTSAMGPRHGFVNALPYEPVFDYTYSGVMQSFESSLQRLGRPRINILLAHDLGVMTHGAAATAMTDEFLAGGYPAMLELQRDGHVDAIGIGVNEIAICEQLLGLIPLDVILLAGRYTLLEQGGVTILDRCARAGVQVIVGGPFNSGLLVEHDDAGSRHYNYAAAPPQIVRKAQSLRITCDRHRTPLPAAALQFPLAHPAVTCALAGLSSSEEVSQAITWSDFPIPPELWAELRASKLIDPAAPAPESAQPRV